MLPPAVQSGAGGASASTTGSGGGASTSSGTGGGNGGDRDNGLAKSKIRFSRQRRPSNESLSSSDESSDELVCDELGFIGSDHAKEILSGLNELRREGHFCDVTLSVESFKFPAHRNVLAALSPYFRAMFTSKLAESRQSVVSLSGVEAPVMSLLLDYAYTSGIVITRNNVQSLLTAANLLQILPVRDAACRFLESHIDTSNCVGIHCFAETHACTDLQEKARQFTLQHFWDVGHGEEFLSLTPQKLIEFISSDDLHVEHEESVFQVVIKWYNHNPEQRKIDFDKVLEHVRLPLVSPYFLHDCVEPMSIIRHSTECRLLVEEAKMFHLLPDRRSEIKTPRTRLRKNAGTVTVIVAVGGEDDKVVLRSVECYDPVAQIWHTLACLPFAVSKHGLVVSGTNRLYLAGGEFPDGRVSHSMWRYDPILNVWHEMASMLLPRSELGLAMLDGFVYAVGGWEGSYRLDSVERYNPETNIWQLIPTMKMAVTSPAVVAHDGMLYVTGGAILEDGDGIELVARYDPRTNAWMYLAPMLIPRSGSAACVLDGYIYVVGGWHASTENTNKVERYNIETNTWEFRASMIERRYRPGIAVVNGKIFVLGGEEGWDRYHDTIECYCPETDTWQFAGDLPTSRSWLSCVPLQIVKRKKTSSGDT